MSNHRQVLKGRMLQGSKLSVGNTKPKKLKTKDKTKKAKHKSKHKSQDKGKHSKHRGRWPGPGTDEVLCLAVSFGEVDAFHA